MAFRRIAMPAALVAAGAALLAPAADAGHMKQVAVASNFYAPFKVTVKQGERVRFKWQGGSFEFHDVNVRKGPTKFSSPLQAAGSWTTKKLVKSGKYQLFCSQHEEMTMTLVVKKR
jgi:plastocyanin